MQPSAPEAVCQLRDTLASRIGESRFHTWFGDLTTLDLGEDRLTVSVPNRFIGQWIANNYLADLKAAVQDVVGGERPIDVRVQERTLTRVRRDADDADSDDTTPRFAVDDTPEEDGDAGDGAMEGPVPVQHVRRPARPAPQALRGRLDSYVVGDSNRLAYSAACALARAPGEAFRPLVLHGGCGLGKTHLLQGICNFVRDRHPTLEWRYISGEEFTNEFIYAVKAGRIDLFRQRFRNVDLLVIDDIHFLANKKATQDEFLHTFDAIDACGRSVALSSDRHPRTIAQLSEPLINRLISGIVVEVKPPDLATRREIVRRRAEKMNCLVPDNVLDYIAEHVTRNVRELEGALYKLAALSSLSQNPITVELARRALEEHLLRTRGAPQATDLEKAAASYFGVSRELLHGKSRDRTVSLARAVAMYLIRKHTQMSLPEIGRVMGNKNHSTVLMAIQRLEGVLRDQKPVSWKTARGRNDADLRDILRQLESSLGLAD